MLPRFDEALANEAICAMYYRFEPFLRKAVQVRLEAGLALGVAGR